MGLKYKIAKLEDVPEAVRALYIPDAAGGFVLDAEGVVPKERLDEFRTNNIALQQRIDQVKNIDPARYAELVALQTSIQEKKLMDAGQVDEVVNLRVATMKTALEGENNTLKNSLAASTRQLEMLMIDNVVKSVAIKAGVVPTAVDDIVLRAKTTYVVENGVPTPKNDGKVVYGKDGTNPMPINEWVDGLRTSAPHLFQGSTGGGAGGGNHASGNKDMGKMSAIEKINAGLAAGAIPMHGKLPGES